MLLSFLHVNHKNKNTRLGAVMQLGFLACSYTRRTSFPSDQRSGRFRRRRRRRRCGSEPGSWASQCADCLSEHIRGAPTERERAVKNTLDYWSRRRLDLTLDPGGGQTQSCCHKRPGDCWTAEVLTTNRGKVECTTCTVRHPLLSLAAGERFTAARLSLNG